MWFKKIALTENRVRTWTKETHHWTREKISLLGKKSRGSFHGREAVVGGFKVIPLFVVPHFSMMNSHKEYIYPQLSHYEKHWKWKNSLVSRECVRPSLGGADAFPWNHQYVLFFPGLNFQICSNSFTRVLAHHKTNYFPNYQVSIFNSVLTLFNKLWALHTHTHRRVTSLLL